MSVLSASTYKALIAKIGITAAIHARMAADAAHRSGISRTLVIDHRWTYRYQYQTAAIGFHSKAVPFVNPNGSIEFPDGTVFENVAPEIAA